MMYLIIVLVLVVLLAIFTFNSLVSLHSRAAEEWADIDVQLKRRYDLIPNLVNTVKGYATHESQAFEKIAQARSMAMQAGTPAQKGEAENALSGTLKSLFAISEAYPDLKANTNFLSIQQELGDTENKIQAARRFYNGNVRELNIKAGSFPSNVFAAMFGFRKMDFFQLEAGSAEKNAVEVKF